MEAVSKEIDMFVKYENNEQYLFPHWENKVSENCWLAGGIWSNRLALGQMLAYLFVVTLGNGLHTYRTVLILASSQVCAAVSRLDGNVKVWHSQKEHLLYRRYWMYVCSSYFVLVYCSLQPHGLRWPSIAKIDGVKFGVTSSLPIQSG